MPVFVVGINHHSAPLDLREKLAFPQERQADALADLAAQPGVAEAVLVSTCNRTEVYCRADDARAASAWLAAEGAKASLSLEGHLYCHAEDAAVRHAFRGEPRRGRARVVGAAVHLGEVARRDEHRLCHAGLGGEVGERIGLALQREGELLAQLERRAMVVDPDDENGHGGDRGSFRL